jgi:hypothetical protein
VNDLFRPSILLLVLGPCMMTSCGVVGPPVPPEMVGVAPIIERQKKLQAPPGEHRDPAKEPVPGEGSESMGAVGEHDGLPPLRPIGTR